jgi:hypothetical protein
MMGLKRSYVLCILLWLNLVGLLVAPPPRRNPDLAVDPSNDPDLAVDPSNDLNLAVDPSGNLNEKDYADLVVDPADAAAEDNVVDYDEIEDDGDSVDEEADEEEGNDWWSLWSSILNAFGLRTSSSTTRTTTPPPTTSTTTQSTEDTHSHGNNYVNYRTAQRQHN